MLDVMVPLSQRTFTGLRARAVELRRMAHTATTQETRAALLVLAARFDALADRRAAEANESRDC